MDAAFNKGDRIRWTLTIDGRVMWAEGSIVAIATDDSGETIIEMRVERTQEWPAAERCRIEGQLIYPTAKPWSSIERVPQPAPDPLDVEYDGVTLRTLLSLDENRRRDPDHCLSKPMQRGTLRALTGAQRAAVSAHWSAELKRKVETTRPRLTVLCDSGEADE